jgi:hypothetical protein
MHSVDQGAHWQSELLVEIAVVHVTLPIHADQFTAHQVLEVIGTVRRLKQRQVLVKFPV